MVLFPLGGGDQYEAIFMIIPASAGRLESGRLARLGCRRSCLPCRGDAGGGGGRVQLLPF